MRRDYFGPNMAVSVYNTVSNCKSCARNSSNTKYRRHLHLFPPTNLLQFFAMDIFGPLPKTTNGNQHVIIITDRYSKLTRTVFTAQLITNTVAENFFTARVIPYCIPVYLTTDNGTQFVSNLFAMLCNHHGTKHPTTTAYQPQTSVQGER